MSAWVLVPCLIALRSEFNALNPARDKGADGSIGDSAHTSSSDHTPDEDSDVLRDHDADSKNEVHALDIDSTGPWPDGLAFNEIILKLVERERAEYNHPTIKARLKYVIWNRRIATRSNGWAWAPYSLSDPHTNHAHFSALYTTDTESDTRSWGVEDMALTSADGITVWKTDIIPNPSFRPDSVDNPNTTAFFAVGDIWRRVGGIESTLAGMTSRLSAIESALSRLAAATPAPGVPPITTEQVIEALREVLRNGVA